MADRFMHKDGLKSQDVELRGGKLIKKVNRSVNPTEGTIQGGGMASQRNVRVGEAAEETPPTRTTPPGERQPGVSGYLRPKGSVYRGLEEAEPPEQKERK